MSGFGIASEKVPHMKLTKDSKKANKTKIETPVKTSTPASSEVVNKIPTIDYSKVEIELYSKISLILKHSLNQTLEL